MSVEESFLADLEKKLANNLFVKGAQPSHEDAEAFEKFITANVSLIKINIHQFGLGIV